ncbi:unnamed protein product [Cochlearia groenlandica]
MRDYGGRSQSSIVTNQVGRILDQTIIIDQQRRTHGSFGMENLQQRMNHIKDRVSTLARRSHWSLHMKSIDERTNRIEDHSSTLTKLEKKSTIRIPPRSKPPIYLVVNKDKEVESYSVEDSPPSLSEIVKLTQLDDQNEYNTHHHGSIKVTTKQFTHFAIRLCSKEIKRIMNPHDPQIIVLTLIAQWKEYSSTMEA